MRRIKKVTSIFLSVIMVFSVFMAVPLTANAAEGLFYDYRILEDGTAEVTGINYVDYDHHGGEVFLELYLHIPSVIDGYKVTSIGKSFINNERITNDAGYDSYLFYINGVDIPYGVTNICDSGFENGWCLEEVKISSSVTSIGNSAFYGCENLKSITILESVTSIGIQAFESGITIRGFANTAAEQYANENGCNFIALDDSIGDVNCDGVISVGDATILQKNLADTVVLTPKQLSLADVNGDGVVNVNDATEIQRKLVNK